MEVNRKTHRRRAAQTQTPVEQAEHIMACSGLETRATTEAEIWREIWEKEVTWVQLWA